VIIFAKLSNHKILFYS